MSLVGVSLGGVFARDLARSYADLVRQVITLGSPFRLPVRYSGPELTNTGPLYRAFRPRHSTRTAERPEEDDLPLLSVPSTAIYTRTDGVVPWQSCLEREAATSQERRGLGQPLRTRTQPAGPVGHRGPAHTAGGHLAAVPAPRGVVASSDGLRLAACGLRRGPVPPRVGNKH